MESRFAVVTFFAALTIARADLVVLQKFESENEKGTVATLQLKGSKLRVDVPSRAGLLSAIVDMDNGDSLTLMHGQKWVLKRSGAMTKVTIEVLRNKGGRTIAGDASKTVAVGRKEKVGEFTADVFTWKGGNGLQTIWVTQDLPDYPRVKEQFDRLWKSASADLPKGIIPDIATLPGIVVKTEVATNGKKYTATVLSVKEEDIDPARFEAPPDYRDPAKGGAAADPPSQN